MLVHVDPEEDQQIEAAATNVVLQRDPAEIEKDVRAVVAKFPDIHGVSHVTCHFLRQTVRVIAWIEVD